MKDDAIEALAGLRSELEVERMAGGMKLDDPDLDLPHRRSRRSRSSWRDCAQPGRFALELDVYILVVGGLALLEVVMATRQAYPRAAKSALAEALERAAARPVATPPELERLERELTLGSSTAFDLHYRLRPTLREIADERLAARGLRLDGGGAAVEEALGEELWELVRPDREPPPKRFAARDLAGRSRARRRAAGGAVTRRRAPRQADRILDEVERAVVGKRDALELVLLGILADGHVLLEDFPGLAKTLIARSFAQVTSTRLRAHPVHARPDAVRTSPARRSSTSATPTSSSAPARSSPTSSSPTRSTAPRRRRRPRCSRRCRSGRSRSRATTHPLEPPFLVLATQNPIEYEGTYPLPEAQLDRFMLRIGVGYPEREDEWEMLERRLERERRTRSSSTPVVDRDDAARDAARARAGARLRSDRPATWSTSSPRRATSQACRSARARAARSRC